MSSSQLLPRMKRELEILEREPPPGIVCYPVDDNLLHFCAQIKGPKDTPYEDGLFKVDVQIPSRYPMEPPKMQFITPIYHPNVDDAGRICLDILKMPPKGSWKPSLNISTTLTSLSVLMGDPNPDDPLSVEIASEFKENKSLFSQKARQSTLKHAVDDKKMINSGDLSLESEQASSSIPASSLSVLFSSQNVAQEFEQASSSTSSINMLASSSLPGIQQVQQEQSVQSKIPESPQKVVQENIIPKNLNKTEENNLPIFTQKRERKKILSLSRNAAIKKKAPLEQISNQLASVPTISTSVKSNISQLNNSKLSQEEEVKKVEKRKPLGDITKKSINVVPVSTINSQGTTNQTQVTEENLRKPLGDITKKSINVMPVSTINSQGTTNQTQVTEENLALNKAERKRKLLRKKPIDVPSKRQELEDRRF